MTSGLWHRGTSSSLLYKSCRKWSGNEILSKGHGRAHRSHTFDSLLRAPPSPPSPTLDYWTKCKSVYINTTKKSSWILRLIETAWVMLLCLIACAFQNGFGIFKPFIRNGPCLFWALNSTWHMSMYKTGKEGWWAMSALLEGLPNWFGYGYNLFICCAHRSFHIIVGTLVMV